MEPADLNSPDREDDDLKALLQAHRAPALPDNGFSTRVLSALPPPRRTNVFQLSLWFGGGLIGLLFATIKGATSWASLSIGATGIAQAFAPVTRAISDPWFCLAVALTGVSLLIAFAFERGSRSSG